MSNHLVMTDGRSSKRRRALTLLAAVTCVAALLVAPGAASANGVEEPQPLVDGLAGPLSIDVNHKGDVLVGQNFAGLVSKVSKNGSVKDLVEEANASAVAWGPLGTVVYSVVNQEEEISQLKLRFPNGKTKLLADIWAHEVSTNPDAGNNYGVQGITEECAEEWPSEDMGPAQYPGQIDSNPYNLAVTPWGVYVADAGGNTIRFVDWLGRVKTVAVLPVQPLVIPDDPTDLGLPECVGGLTYNFEPVPTDIELSHKGAFVTLLPGGPEDPSLGARGKVEKVNLHNGTSRTVASGILSATNLAISPKGDIYVTELFGGRVAKVTKTGLETVAEFMLPAAVEWHNGKLVVSHDVFTSGKISVINP